MKSSVITSFSGAWRIVEVGAIPVVELGIVEKTGSGGGLGAGLYRPELKLFSQACAGLNV